MGDQIKHLKKQVIQAAVKADADGIMNGLIALEHTPDFYETPHFAGQIDTLLDSLLKKSRGEAVDEKIIKLFEALHLADPEAYAACIEHPATVQVAPEPDASCPFMPSNHFQTYEQVFSYEGDLLLGRMQYSCCCLGGCLGLTWLCCCR